jgi:hypothetical protein
VSVVVGTTAVAIGIAVVVRSAVAGLAALFLLVGLTVGSSLLVVGIRRWLRGQAVPGGLGIASGFAALAGAALLGHPGLPGAGAALLAGLAGGCMLGNVWAIGAARRNRRP